MSMSAAHDDLCAAEMNESETTSPADGLSEYEMQRRRTMERNHRKLEELGLLGRQQAADAVINGSGRAGSASGISISKAAMNRRKAPLTPAEPMRRSLRNQGKTPPVYKDHAVGFDDDQRAVGHKRPRPPTNIVGDGSPDNSSSKPMPPRPRTSSTPSSADSSRNLECNILLLMGEYLGKRFAAFGKDAVMGTSTKSVPPKFSRMSGATEWKNAVFLWVNVGEEGGGYTNLFERVVSKEYDSNIPASTGGGPAQIVKHEELLRKMLDTRGNQKRVDCVENDTTDGGAGAVTGSGSSRRRRGEILADAVDREDRDGTVKYATGDNSKPLPHPRHYSGHAQKKLVGRDEKGSPATHCRSSSSSSSKGTLKMTWYAGSRMTSETAVIRRLLEAGSIPTSSALSLSSSGTAAVPQTVSQTATPITKAENTTSIVHGNSVPGETATNHGNITSEDRDTDDSVLLFCRLPKEPYVFCGRLGYIEHWSDERPVRFMWRLLDAERLSGSMDFEAVVGAAGAALK